MRLHQRDFPKQAGYKKVLCRGAILCTGIMLANALLAQEETEVDIFEFSGAVELGAEHNSNLSITELERSADESDTAAVLDTEFILGWQPNARLAGEAGYSFSTTRYQELDAYDLDMHLLYGDLSYDFDLLTVGTSYYYADADLGGDSFLTLDQYSLYVGRFISNQWYLRGALNQTEKSFTTFNNRDADTDGFSIDSFWFFNQGSSNLSLGYTHEEEETRAPEFIYGADTLRLRFTQDFQMLAKESSFEVGLRWQDRDYDNPYPGLGQPRADERRIFETALTVNVLENLALIGAWEHGGYESNLPSADYNDNRISLSARLSFGKL